MTIPDRIKKINTKKGYRALVDEEYGKGKTQKEAFWKIETEYRSTFGKKRYSSFHSYYNSRYRDVKERLSSN